jgi:hypothetical protein
MKFGVLVKLGEVCEARAHHSIRHMVASPLPMCGHLDSKNKSGKITFLDPDIRES